MVAVNPEISSGLPIASVNRRPQPASRPELYSTPATKGMTKYMVIATLLMVDLASDPAQNPYWKRDVRRAYPQLSVVTQSELSSFLIEHSGNQACVCWLHFQTCFTKLFISFSRIPAPTPENSDVPAAPQPILDLSEAISTITSVQKVYSESRLPPSLPVPYKRWIPERAPDAPHDKHAYFPMLLYR